jgi:hypothetical protein
LALTFRLTEQLRASAAAVAAVWSMQLMGSRVYAFKRWIPMVGFGLTVNTGLVRALAAAMTALGTVFLGIHLAAVVQLIALDATFRDVRGRGKMALGRARRPVAAHRPPPQG